MAQSPSSSATAPALTVSQLNRQAKRLLEGHFEYVWVSGEVSNFASPSSGHWYFSLKDAGAQARCAMFRNRNQRLRFTPANGDAVRLRAKVSLYEGRGEFQLIVEHLEADGAGALQAAFEALKARLGAQGVFDPGRKKTLPTHVRQVGIITSPTGAAIADMLTVLRRRSPGIRVFLFPVSVQGDAAAPEISAALTRANRWQAAGKVALDALIVGRGGGSLEDLWAFNEETVARAIAASEIPVISAVGHEVDFSIADLAADVRAATPSAAAELISPDQRELKARLANAYERLLRAMEQQLERPSDTLHHLQRRLKHPGDLLREQAQKLDDLEQRLIFVNGAAQRHRQGRLDMLSARLQGHSPARALGLFEQRCAVLATRLHAAMARELDARRHRLARHAQVLDSVSPLRTLERGYAIVTASNGAVIESAQQVKPGDDVSARLAHGSLHLSVKRVEDS